MQQQKTQRQGDSTTHASFSPHASPGGMKPGVQEGPGSTLPCCARWVQGTARLPQGARLLGTAQDLPLFQALCPHKRGLPAAGGQTTKHACMSDQTPFYKNKTWPLLKDSQESPLLLREGLVPLAEEKEVSWPPLRLTAGHRQKTRHLLAPWLLPGYPPHKAM